MPWSERSEPVAATRPKDDRDRHKSIGALAGRRAERGSPGARGASTSSESRRSACPPGRIGGEIWVLETCYELDRARIQEVLTHLSVNQAYRLEVPERCEAALGLFRDSNVDFSDCLILAGCQACKLPLYTFDKRLSRLDGAEPVPIPDAH